MTLPGVGQTGCATGAGQTGCTTGAGCGHVGCTNCTGCAHVGCTHAGTGHAKLIGCWKHAVVQNCPANCCRSACNAVHDSVTSGQRLQGSMYLLMQFARASTSCTSP